MRNILIICIGNICRSPMAEGLLRYLLVDKKEIQVSSAGITALTGQPPDPLAQKVLQEKKGIDISHYRARQVNRQILINSDLILVMDLNQKKQIECNLPSIYGRVHRLGNWGGFDIPDPYRRPKLIFEQTFVLIEQCLNDWHARIWK